MNAGGVLGAGCPEILFHNPCHSDDAVRLVECCVFCEAITEVVFELLSGRSSCDQNVSVCAMCVEAGGCPTTTN